MRIVAAAEGLTLLGGHGSCVIDDYLSRVGANPFREIACLGAGSHGTTVVIAAGPRPRWRSVAPLLEQAVSHFRFM